MLTLEDETLSETLNLLIKMDILQGYADAEYKLEI